MNFKSMLCSIVLLLTTFYANAQSGIVDYFDEVGVLNDSLCTYNGPGSIKLKTGDSIACYIYYNSKLNKAENTIGIDGASLTTADLEKITKISKYTYKSRADTIKYLRFEKLELQYISEIKIYTQNKFVKFEFFSDFFSLGLYNKCMFEQMYPEKNMDFRMYRIYLPEGKYKYYFYNSEKKKLMSLRDMKVLPYKTKLAKYFQNAPDLANKIANNPEYNISMDDNDNIKTIPVAKKIFEEYDNLLPRTDFFEGVYKPKIKEKLLNGTWKIIEICTFDNLKRDVQNSQMTISISDREASVMYPKEDTENYIAQISFFKLKLKKDNIEKLTPYQNKANPRYKNFYVEYNGKILYNDFDSLNNDANNFTALFFELFEKDDKSLALQFHVIGINSKYFKAITTKPADDTTEEVIVTFEKQ